MEYFFYRKNQLVYVGVLKCASTFYNIVMEHNNWKQIHLFDINWREDHVFGFIMDPATRYMKGLAEDVVDPNTHWSIDNLPIYKDCITFTFHSVPISSILKFRVNQIDWIPLDTEVTSDQLLEKLLKKYNIEFNWPTYANRHESSDIKTSVYQKIKNTIDIDNHVIRRGLGHDIQLYKTVLEKIDIHGDTWDKISWMRNK